jgi:7-cyano-7-deazaguanine synthase in queuosine biosynthesis
MCGILGLWCQKSVPDISIIDTLFTYAEKRGKDGVGFVIYDSIRKMTVYDKHVESYSQVKDTVLKDIKDNLKIGSVLLGICRSQPETEGNTTKENMQPIIAQGKMGDSMGLMLVHNGAISNRIYKELKDWTEKERFPYNYTTKIDSEAIIVSYLKHNRNIKEALEYLSGGAACLMVDVSKNALYIWADHQPISHAYVRGDLGCYFLHSSDECLRKIVKDVTGSTQDGMCVWEDWYSHPLRGHRIKILDLDSGFVSTMKYKPRYIIGKYFDTNFSEKKNNEELVLVATSGGMDSSCTLSMLKMANYKNIIACHFKYNARATKCENLAIQKICNELKIPLKVFDLEKIYSEIDSSSMLFDKDNFDITTGTEEGLKTTAAWVAGRNMMFLNIMATFAESQVMKYNYKTIYLMGGFLNLTESGCFINCENNKVLLPNLKNTLPENIKVNDKILSFNFDERKLQETEVKKIFKTKYNKKYIIKVFIKEGPIYSEKELEISENQPWFVKKKGWTPTKDLKIDDILHSFRECKAAQSAYKNPTFQTEEYRKKISERNKKIVRTEEWNKNISKSLKGHIKSEEWCKNISKGLMGKMVGLKNPMTGHIRSNETSCWCGKIHRIPTREQFQIINKKLWENSEYRIKNIESCKKFWDSEKSFEVRKKLSIVAKDNIKKYIEKHGMHWSQTPEGREKCRQGTLKAIKEGKINPANCFMKHPNKQEAKLVKLFEENNIPLRFVGDGQIWMTSKGCHMNPDFINIDQKKIVEFYGGIGFFHTLEEIQQRHEKYTEINWSHLAILETEMNDLEKVKNKVLNFLYEVHNGWKIMDIKIIDGEYEMLDFWCEPNNNFFINKMITHNSYPDNSENFLNSMLQSFKYGTLIGDRIKPLYGLCDLMKTDQIYLMKYFGLLETIYRNTISCDRPIIELTEEGNKIACNCSKDNKPACGSGALSYWACKMLGLNDLTLRNYYEVNDPNYKLFEPDHLKEGKILQKDIFNIIDRIHFPEDKLNILREKAKYIQKGD